MNESEKHFSFTGAASITSGRAQKQIPISSSVIVITLGSCGYGLPRLAVGVFSALVLGFSLSSASAQYATQWMTNGVPTQWNGPGYVLAVEVPPCQTNLEIFLTGEWLYTCDFPEGGPIAADGCWFYEIGSPPCYDFNTGFFEFCDSHAQGPWWQFQSPITISDPQPGSYYFGYAPTVNYECVWSYTIQATYSGPVGIAWTDDIGEVPLGTTGTSGWWCFFGGTWGTNSILMASETIMGPDAGDFSVSTNYTGVTMPSGQNFCCTASFTPSRLGAECADILCNETNAPYGPFLVHLTGVGVPSVITTQPQDELVVVGQSANFAVSLNSASPLSYQWLKNDVPITNATGNSFSITNASAADAGKYQVVAMNGYGSVTSSVATLTVIVPVNAGVFTDDFAVSHDYTNGQVAGTMWDGVLSSDHLAHGDANITTPGQLTWFALPNSGWEGASANAPTLFKAVMGDFDVSVQIANMTSQLWSDGGLIVRVPDVGWAGPGEDYLALRYFAAQGFNGTRSTDDGSTININYPVFEPWLRIQRLSDTFRFYTRSNALSSWVLRDTQVRGDMAAAGALEVGLWFGTFSGASGGANFAHFALEVGLPPQITTQPTNQTGLAGSNMVCTVAVSGTLPLMYQWQFNGTSLSDNARISGSLSNCLTISNVLTTDTGNYQVIVTNTYGAVTSSAVRLTVLAPLVAGTTKNPDGSVTIWVGASPNNPARLWAATNLTPPILWSALATNNNVGPSGTWQFIDSNAPAYPTRLYRFSMP